MNECGTVGEKLPGIVIWHCSHAGADDFTVRKNDFQTGMHHEMISIRRISNYTLTPTKRWNTPSFNSISENRSSTKIRNIKPQLEFMILNILVKIKESNTRLNKSISEFL